MNFSCILNYEHGYDSSFPVIEFAPKEICTIDHVRIYREVSLIHPRNGRIIPIYDQGFFSDKNRTKKITTLSGLGEKEFIAISQRFGLNPIEIKEAAKIEKKYREDLDPNIVDPVELERFIAEFRGALGYK